jgi:hypothetical protein
MAGIMETLVLRGNRVSDVVTGMVRSGSNPVDRQTPDLLSHPRRLSQPTLATGYPAALPLGFIDANDEDRGGQRAGRLGSLVGVLVRRSRASSAGRAILSGWSLTVGGPKASAVWCPGLSMTKTPASGAKVLRERHASRFTGGVGIGSRRMLQPGKREASRPACSMPAGGTFLASARGNRGA